MARLILSAGVDDVVLASSGDLAGHFDAAIVDRPRPDLEADVTIQLPGTSEAGEQAVLDVDLDGMTIRLDRPDELLACLDLIRPASRPSCDD